MFFFLNHENIRKQWAWGSPSLRKPPYYGAWLQPLRSQLHGERQWFEAKTDVQWINKALVFFTKWLSPWNGCEEAGQELAEEQEQTSLVFFTSSPWRGKGPDQRVLNCLECEVSSQWPHAHSSMIRYECSHHAQWISWLWVARPLFFRISLDKANHFQAILFEMLSKGWFGYGSKLLTPKMHGLRS